MCSLQHPLFASTLDFDVSRIDCLRSDRAEVVHPEALEHEFRLMIRSEDRLWFGYWPFSVNDTARATNEHTSLLQQDLKNHSWLPQIPIPDTGHIRTLHEYNDTLWIGPTGRDDLNRFPVRPTRNKPLIADSTTEKPEGQFTTPLPANFGIFSRSDSDQICGIRYISADCRLPHQASRNLNLTDSSRNDLLICLKSCLS